VELLREDKLKDKAWLDGECQNCVMLRVSNVVLCHCRQMFVCGRPGRAVTSWYNTLQYIIKPVRHVVVQHVLCEFSYHGESYRVDKVKFKALTCSHRPVSFMSQQPVCIQFLISKQQSVCGLLCVQACWRARQLNGCRCCGCNSCLLIGKVAVE
jgi:hypothetical protein